MSITDFKKDSPLLYIIIGLILAALFTTFLKFNSMASPDNSSNEVAEFSLLEVQRIEEQKLTPPQKLTDLMAPGITIINFWASWCSICQAEVPTINELNSWIKDKNLHNRIRIIGIAVQDDKLNARSSKKAQDANFTLAFDHTKKIEEFFEVDFLPKTVVVNSDTKDSYWIKGPLNSKSIHKIKELAILEKGENGRNNRSTHY